MQFFGEVLLPINQRIFRRTKRYCGLRTSSLVLVTKKWNVPSNEKTNLNLRVARDQ